MGHLLFSGVLTLFVVCGKGSVILTGHRTYVPYYRAAAQTPFVLAYYDYHTPVLPSMFVNPQFGPSDRIGPILEAESPRAGIRTVQAQTGSDRGFPRFGLEAAQARLGALQAGTGNGINRVFAKAGLEAAQAGLEAAQARIGTLQAETGSAVNTGFPQVGLDAAQARIGAVQAETGSATSTFVPAPAAGNGINTGSHQAGLGAGQAQIGALQAETESAINTGVHAPAAGNGINTGFAQAGLGAGQAQIGALQAETGSAINTGIPAPAAGNGINTGFAQAGLGAGQAQIGALQAETGSAINTGVPALAAVGPKQTVNDPAQTGVSVPASGDGAPTNSSGNYIWNGYSTITSAEYPLLLRKINTALQANGPELTASKINFAGFKVVGPESLTGPGMINLVNFSDNSNKNCYAYLIEPTGKDAEIPKESIVCAT